MRPELADLGTQDLRVGDLQQVVILGLDVDGEIPYRSLMTGVFTTGGCYQQNRDQETTLLTVFKDYLPI